MRQQFLKSLGQAYELHSEDATLSPWRKTIDAMEQAKSNMRM